MSFLQMGYVDFPDPQDININMMPFVPGSRNTIPNKLKGYIDIIETCFIADRRFYDKVCYLTVHESLVEAGKTQRRPGIHTDASSARHWGGNWGRAIWIANTVRHSCRIWDYDVPERRLGEHGCAEHIDLSEIEFEDSEENELIELTDRTPHESLPQTKTQYRQFFRLVGPEIHGWYSYHNTPNALCPLPKDIRIIHGDKFASI